MNPPYYKRRFTKKQAIGLLVLGVLFCGVQAVLYWRAVAPARNETEKIDLVVHHRPGEMPGLLGLTFILMDAVLVASQELDQDETD